MKKEIILHGQGRLCRYSTQLKLNSEFYKKKELEENPIYSFKQIRSTDFLKKVLVLVSKILMDGTIPSQIEPWEYEEMKNSDGKVNIEAFHDVKKQYLGGRDYSPTRE